MKILFIRGDSSGTGRQIGSEYADFTDVRGLKDHAGHDRILAARRV
jgi:hypothetical protein